MPAPLTCTPERVAEVLRRLASGRSLWSVCRDPDMPSDGTLAHWARGDPDFAARLEAVRGRGRGGRGHPALGGARQCKYSAELAAGICAALAEGFSLREVCANPAVPVAPNTVMNWARRRPDFAVLYAEATRPRPGPNGGLRIGRGRRGAYTPERAQAVIERLLQGRAMSDIVRDPDMPSWPVITQWRRRHMDFHLALQAARRFQLDLLLDEILAAAEDGFTAPEARRIATGLMARGTWPMGAGRAEEVVEVVPPPRAKPGAARRAGAPGIGHNWRGR